MSNEDKKDFNAMMNNNKDMPKIVNLDEEAALKWGGKSMVIAPPFEYNEIINKIPKGKLVTTNEIRKYIASKHNVDITCPLTAGIFINICAWACYQRKDDMAPFFRVVKQNGELNKKYPGNFELQKKLLESEGHKIIEKGRNIKTFCVKDYEKDLIELK